MGELSAAYSSGGSYERTKVNTQKIGDYPAYFLGISSEKWTETSVLYSCSLCKGRGDGRNGEPQGCSRCNGTGKKMDQKAKLRYELRGGVIEEEIVNFRLSAPGTANGKTTKASTLYTRLRAISGLPNPTAAELDAWYSSLAKPVRVPCRLEIDYAEGSTDLAIVGVKWRQAPALGHGTPQAQPVAVAAAVTPAPQPARAPVAVAAAPPAQDDGWSDIDDELPF